MGSLSWTSNFVHELGIHDVQDVQPLLPGGLVRAGVLERLIQGLVQLSPVTPFEGRSERGAQGELGREAQDWSTTPLYSPPKGSSPDCEGEGESSGASAPW